MPMDEISVSKFKATCLAALGRVQRTGRPLRVTRFGKPLADVIPAGSEKKGTAWLGAMKGRGRITGDLVAPVATWDLVRRSR